VEGLEAGADDYLIKPCNGGELRARLRTGERILQLEDKLVAAREEMRFKATHDALTSLWNRGTILEVLDSALHHEDSAAVLLCDIDHFKGINDTYGHLVGDAVLRELSARLRDAVRGTDMIGRFGGEEFLVILNGCGPANLYERADRLRNSVSRSPLPSMAGEISFTVSIGAVALTRGETDNSAEAVLSRADTALYQAKREGRNRVVIAEGLIADQVA
jgi:diguanylate cyclase (GGDEF)-like protein